jgi:hypothetical protein
LSRTDFMLSCTWVSLMYSKVQSCLVLISACI